MSWTKPCIAEMIGTFFLCFAGIGAILSVAASPDGGGGIVAIALAHGLALSVAVSTFGGLSGGHFNPAVTIGMLVTGRIKPLLSVGYIAFQLVGAIVASYACALMFDPQVQADVKLGIPLPAEGVSDRVLFATEFILTFLLMTAIFGAAVDPRGKEIKIGALAIGLTVTFDILAGGAVTGASMNPARSLGPALAHQHFDHHLWYWLAPISGAVAAAVLYHFVLLPKNKEPEAAA